MYVSKTLIAAAAIVGAIVLGFVSRDALDRLTAASAGAMTPAASVGVAPAQDNPVQGDPSTTQSMPDPSAVAGAVTPQGGVTNVYLTIVNNPDGSTATITSVEPVRATASDAAGAAGSATVRASAGPHQVGSGRHAPPRTSHGSNAKAKSTVSPARSLAQAVTMQVSAGLAMTAVGEHIVIAHDGSIVYVGDNGYLNGNTGDAVAGGTVALDAQGSTFSSNHVPSRTSTAATSSGFGTVSTSSANSLTMASAAGSGSGATWTQSPDAAQSTGATWSPYSAGLIGGGNTWWIPGGTSPLDSAFVSYTGNRTADIAGYEDHSVLTRGTGNVVTYDDSNVFLDRDGKINANTGDTDSAGLNAVAVLRSVVSAGPHCDDGCDDESIIQAEAGVFDEGDVAVDGNGNVVWAPDAPDESSSDDDSDDDSLPTDNGDDDDSVEDESPDGDVSDPAEPAETREEADSTRPAADNGPEPEGEPDSGSLIVGGDGIDDLSERVDGNFNVSTYDDSNVVVGGSGDVNAQIGDSDTGGTVVMDIIDSVVAGGNSR